MVPRYSTQSIPSYQTDNCDGLLGEQMYEERAGKKGGLTCAMVMEVRQATGDSGAADANGGRQWTRSSGCGWLRRRQAKAGGPCHPQEQQQVRPSTSAPAAKTRPAHAFPPRKPAPTLEQARGVEILRVCHVLGLSPSPLLCSALTKIANSLCRPPQAFTQQPSSVAIPALHLENLFARSYCARRMYNMKTPPPP